MKKMPHGLTATFLFILPSVAPSLPSLPVFDGGDGLRTSPSSFFEEFLVETAMVVVGRRRNSRGSEAVCCVVVGSNDLYLVVKWECLANSHQPGNGSQ